MKAYKVGCCDGDHGDVVVFANLAREVDRRANSEHCDCEWVDLRVKRAPEFDDCSPGPVTVQQYLARGWWWKCAGCSRELMNEDSPLVIAGYAFCDRFCAMRERSSWPEDTSNCHDSVIALCGAIDEYLLLPSASE